MTSISIVLTCKMSYYICLLFGSIVTANWFQRAYKTIELQNVICSFPAHSITACQLKCKLNKMCSSFGMGQIPELGYTGDCYIISKNSSNDTKGDVGFIHLYVFEKVELHVTDFIEGAQDGDLRWPEGEYGILSRDKCPSNWYEYTECYNAGENTTQNFTLNVGECFGNPHSFTLRYCFKGDNVPTRPGGFSSRKSARNIYLIAMTHRCGIFGVNSGKIRLDLKDLGTNFNKFGNNGLNGLKFDVYHPLGTQYGKQGDVHIEFCEFEISNPSSLSNFTEIGEFHQPFGFFITPGDSSCMELLSPHGVLLGRKEELFINLEGGRRYKEGQGGRTPFVYGPHNDVTVGICVYNPS